MRCTNPLLAGMLSQIGFKAEGQEYLGARNRKLFIFRPPASTKKKPKWIMAAELVETSKLFARTVARIEPQWLEEIARPLLKYQYFEPHWEQQRGQVVAFEQSTLYGLIVNPRKRVNFASIEPATARSLFIQEALVAQQFNSKLPFYRRNIQLLKEVTEYEEKSRRRDLVIDEQWQADFYARHFTSRIYFPEASGTLVRKKPQRPRKKALEFTRADLLSPAAAGIGANDFPVNWNGRAWPFRSVTALPPGSLDDGVSLSVPAAGAGAGGAGGMAGAWLCCRKSRHTVAWLTESNAQIVCTRTEQCRSLFASGQPAAGQPVHPVAAIY